MWLPVKIVLANLAISCLVCQHVSSSSAEWVEGFYLKKDIHLLCVVPWPFLRSIKGNYSEKHLGMCLITQLLVQRYKRFKKKSEWVGNDFWYLIWFLLPSRIPLAPPPLLGISHSSSHPNWLADILPRKVLRSKLVTLDWESSRANLQLLNVLEACSACRNVPSNKIKLYAHWGRRT